MHGRIESNRVILLGFLLIFFLGVFVWTGETLYAQSFLNENNGINLVLSPQFPTPNSTVEVSLDDYSIDTVGATIMWYVDSVEKREFRNARAMSYVVPALGKKSTVRVVLSRTNAPALSSSISIIPTTVDIVLESDTYTPNFYKGRSLPSGESAVRAIAIVHDGGTTADSTYSYKWSQDGSVFFGGPVKGKNVLEFEMPRYDGGVLTVEVIKNDGTTLGRKTTTLTIATPELHFYEYSPLRGLYTKEVETPLAFIGEETTIYGEPYFMNTTMSEKFANFTWRIDGEKVAHDASLPNAITLQKTGGDGGASVELMVVTKTQIPQFVQKIFTLVF